jgi:serine protease AprX
MRRILVFLGLVVCLVSLSPSRPSGQLLPTVSDDLLELRQRGGRMRVIVSAPDVAPSALRGRARGVLRRELAGGMALEVTRDEFDALLKDPTFSHISADLPVHGDMAITNKVTGASTVWQSSGGLLGLLATPGYMGAGVGVAVVDSGIAPHSALDTRVVARVNLVSWEAPSTGDGFGHGTHIAGIIGGNTTAAAKVTAAFAGGSAPAVRLVDVRVLGANGSGLTSDVIAGTDWTIANREKYGIRVVNLSLGHPITEPAATDPLCLAVARATGAGLVVVVSAGNYGQTADGTPVLGGITSPGNSPLAITVGAIDTKGTLDRSDDRVAPFSSRGPTRFDMTVKPDVVAPGVKIVSLEAAGSYLSGTYPAWHIAGTASNSYMRLNGTSMSAAVVSGGVALMLNAYPSLTPAQVKIALQMGATFVPQGGLNGAGTGSVNFPAAMKIANTGLVPSLLTTVTTLLGASSGATFVDRGTLIQRVYDRSGVRLLGLLDLGVLFGSPNGGEAGVLNLLGQSNPIGSMAPNYVVWGDVAGWSSNYYVVWGDSIQSPSGQYVVWGDAYTGSNYVVWGDTLIPPDGR